jgi:solute carrier family 25 uncoupling protein 27
MLGENPKLYKTAALGMSCGAVGQIIANPFDVIKVQMQNEGKRILSGQSPRSGVTSHSFR